MPPETARPATWGSRPGLDDFCGQRKSGPSLSQNPIHAQAQQRLRRQRHVELFRLNSARVWLEFVDELARHHPQIAADLDRRLGRYAELSPELLHAVGADRFPLRPLRVIGGQP